MVDERIIWLIAMAASAGGMCVASSNLISPSATAATAITPMQEALAIPVDGEEVIVARSDDGLFYLDGQVNGTTVRFLVDSGASTLVLSATDAARADVAVSAHSGVSKLQTATGTTSMRWANTLHFQVAGRKLPGARAAVPGEPMRVSLLGQEILQRLGAVTFEGDRLIIGPVDTVSDD